jgi:para-nitrobenzyl esterase
VTLFGESAGSQDTCLQVVSPKARGLFHRAISQSGGCTTHRKTKEQAEAQVSAFVDAVGCAGAPDELACLRGKSVSELLIEAPVDGAVEAPGGARFNGGTERWDFNPVVDGSVVPAQPRALADGGDFAKVPYILGYNFEEGLLFLLAADPVTTEADYMGALQRLFGDDATRVAEVYRPEDFPTPQDALVRVWGDYRLGCTTDDSARRFAAGGAPVFAYTFAHTIPGLEALAATHGAEMPFLFGTLAEPTAEAEALGETMQGYWTRFAREGDPNGGDALQWPALDDATDERILFGDPLEVRSGFRRTECDLWRTIYAAAFD